MQQLGASPLKGWGVLPALEQRLILFWEQDSSAEPVMYA